MSKCDKTNRRKTLDEFALEAEGNEEEASLSLFDLGLPPVSAQILNKGQHRSITHRSPRKQVLRLRSLVARGRARTADPIIEPVFRLPNEMCWHVLKFWRATCATTGEVL